MESLTKFRPMNVLRITKLHQDTLASDEDYFTEFAANENMLNQL